MKSNKNIHPVHAIYGFTVHIHTFHTHTNRMQPYLPQYLTCMHAAWLVQVYDPTPTELTNRWLVSRTTFSCSFLFFRTSLKMHPAFFFHSEYLNNKRKPTEKNLFHPDCVNFLINSDRERKEEKRFLLRYYPNLPNNPPKTNSISGRDNMGRRRREE